MLILTMIVCCVTAKEIFMQFDYKCDNWLEYIQVGNTKWFPPVTNKTVGILNTVYFKGDIGQLFTVSIFNNDDRDVWMGGILTVGTQEFLTNLTGWKSNPDIPRDNNISKIIKDKC